jgi:hypothetical protein
MAKMLRLYRLIATMDARAPLLRAGHGRQATDINAAELTREAKVTRPTLLLRDSANPMVLCVVDAHFPIDIDG